MKALILACGLAWGFAVTIFFFDSPGLFYRGNGFGLGWSLAQVETLQRVILGAGVAILLLAGRLGPPAQRAAWWIGISMFPFSKALIWSMGKDLERLPITPQSYGRSLVDSFSGTCFDLIVLHLGLGLALLVSKWFRKSFLRGEVSPGSSG